MRRGLSSLPPTPLINARRTHIISEKNFNTPEPTKNIPASQQTASKRPCGIGSFLYFSTPPPGSLILISKKFPPLCLRPAGGNGILSSGLAWSRQVCSCPRRCVRTGGGASYGILLTTGKIFTIMVPALHRGRKEMVHMRRNRQGTLLAHTFQTEAKA